MTTPPHPYIPADVDLSGFEFTPIYSARLRKSKAYLRARACHALLYPLFNLWDSAYREKPAGSLEDDEITIAGAADCMVEQWRVYEGQGALRGFVRCSDGRLYHPVICEIAWGNWLERLKLFYGNACAAIRGHNKRPGAEHRDVPLLMEWVRERYPATARALDGGFGAESKHRLYREWTPAPLFEQWPAFLSSPFGESSPNMGGAAPPRSPNTPPPDPPRLADDSANNAPKGEGRREKQTPQTPLAGARGDPPQGALEQEREARIAGFVRAYAEAFHQPFAVNAAVRRAWREVEAELPDDAALIALIGAFVAHREREEKRCKRALPATPPQAFLRKRTFVALAEKDVRDAEAVAAFEARKLARETAAADARAVADQAKDDALAAKVVAFVERHGAVGVRIVNRLGGTPVAVWLCGDGVEIGVGVPITLSMPRAKAFRDRWGERMGIEFAEEGINIVEGPKP